MADLKISQLNSLTKSTVATNDVIPIVDTSALETKKITYGELLVPQDNIFRIAGSSDNTKLVAFEVDGLTTATTRTLTVPDASTTLVGTDTTQTLTNKTLTSPQINFGSDATGDIYYRSALGTTSRLAAGTTNTILSISSGGIPEWIPNPSASDGSTTVKGVFEEATQAEVIAGTATGGTGARLVMNPSSFITALPTLLQDTTLVKFGGTGADGALTITSGTTTIDLGNAAVVTKNYTSISITGTGSLAFINPNSAGTIIILKSQGEVVLTSSAAPMIDASGMGGIAGVGVSGDNDGTSGTLATDIFSGDSSNGKFGAKRTSSNPTNGGAAYTTLPIYTLSANRLNTRRSIYITSGSGGGGGGSGNPNGGTVIGGDGGRGGGGLIIECAGALNFTTALGISVAGKNGSNGGTTVTAGAGSGGGGGGAGGFALVLYNTLTAASGTINVSGGNGGNGSVGLDTVGAGGQGGGGGGMYAGAGGRGGGGSTGGGASAAGVAGANSVTTSAGGGSAGTGQAGGSHNDGGGGGGGAAGEYFIAQNLIFA